MKAVSWRCNSLLVMCAICRKMEQVSETFKMAPCLQATATWTYHQLAGDLGDGHAEGEQVQAAVPLKQTAG